MSSAAGIAVAGVSFGSIASCTMRAAVPDALTAALVTSTATVVAAGPRSSPVVATNDIVVTPSGSPVTVQVRVSPSTRGSASPGSTGGSKTVEPAWYTEPAGRVAVTVTSLAAAPVSRAIDAV